jgi:tRNA pseudouridine38-40 synthase
LRFALKISYDGNGFYGWQVQPFVRTVSGILMDVLCDLYGKKAGEIKLYGASRTDAGVHAKAQIAHFDAPSERFNPQKLLPAINIKLPDDVRILEIKEVSEDFHARFSAKGKVYCYYISSVSDVFSRRYSMQLKKMPSVRKLNELSLMFTGQHGFTAFSVKESIKDAAICNINQSRWDETISGGLCYTISGDHFMHNMVRMLVGAMLDCERGLFDSADLKNMLNSGIKTHQFKTVSGRGLFLMQVLY